ncbi:palladin-like [Panonychus citri]|uniref:palladin-like n=1 Tax=Panonychus citri TaxID=50023 RepID=UPI0023080499|nr:palladin-like [Panonychus citri]
MAFKVLICFLFLINCVHGQESPKVAPFSSLVKPVIGGKTSFTCQSLTGSPPFQMKWFKDGTEIVDSSTIKIRTNEELSSLIIDSIKSSYSGNYTCKISNRYGQDSYSTELLVEGPPNWIDKPSNVKTKLFQPIILRCAASGYPKSKTEWKKLEGSEWINVSPNNQITIKDESLE